MLVKIHGDEKIMFLSLSPCVHVLLAVQPFPGKLIEKKKYYIVLWGHFFLTAVGLL